MTLPKQARRSLRWALALGAMAFVLHRLFSDPEPLRRILRTGPGVPLGLCLLVALNQLLMSLRFELAMLHTSGAKLGLAIWFRITSVGQMLNLFVPQLGNIYRGVVLKRDHEIPYMSYATALVSFRWLDMVMGIAIAFGVILLLEPALHFAGQSALGLLAAAGLLILVGPMAGAVLLRRLPGGSGLLGRTRERFTTLLETAGDAARSPALAVRFFLLNVVVTLVQTATLWLGFRSVDAAISPSGLVLFQVLVRLSNQVVVTPGNLGITELAFGALAHGSARTLEQGLAVSLLLRAVGSAMVVLLGVASGGFGLLVGGRRALLRQGGARGDDPAQGFSATRK